MKYVLISEDEATFIRETLDEHRALLGDSHQLKSIVNRLTKARAGNFDRYVQALKHTPLCAACVCESQEETCESHATRAHGRELARFLAESYPEREAKPGDHIMDHIEAVLEESRALDEGLTLIFNDTRVPVHPSSKAADVFHHWTTIRERDQAKRARETAEKSEI